MKRLFFFCGILGLIINGCITTLPVHKSRFKLVPLSSEIILSPLKNFSVNTPINWFSTKDNHYSSNEIWLVKENYTAVITVKNINIVDSITNSNTNINSLLIDLSKTTLQLYKRKYSNSFKLLSPPRLYENSNVIFSAFEFEFNSGQVARIAIVEKNKKFFKIKVYSANQTYGKILPNELFSIQESILISLKLY